MRMARTTDRRVPLDYPGADIWIFGTTKMERRYRALFMKKEPWTVRWLDEYVQADDVLYDIGANVGPVTLIAAAARKALVVAFEPGYANFARLCENVALNDCSDRVVAVPLPLSNTNGIVRFVYKTVEAGESRHRMDAAPSGFAQASKDGKAAQAMCSVRLDDAVRTFGLPSPAHVKLDVDGAELQVLQGAVDTLRSATLRSILIESDQSVWNDVSAMLAQAGFELSADMTDERRVANPVYALFVRAVRTGPSDSEAIAPAPPGTP